MRSVERAIRGAPKLAVPEHRDPISEGLPPATHALEAGLRDAMNWLANGVVISDASGAPAFLNTAAREVLSEGDGLHLDGGRLSATSLSETKTLRRLIAAAAAGEAVHPGQGLQVVRPAPRRPLALLVAPAAGRRHLSDRHGCAILTIADPDRAGTPSSIVLQQLHGLTPMEAEVAIEVADGKGLQAVVERLGVSKATVRTHLQHVFEKTGTKRQAQLSWLIAHTCAGLRLEASQTVRMASALSLRMDGAQGGEPR